MPTFDIIITNGTVVDGTGAPGFTADVGIAADRITYIGPSMNTSADRVIEADGLVVAPGFIDMMGQSEYHLLIDPRGMSKIIQGITTEITGEGTSVAPMYGSAADKPREWLRTFGIEIDWVTFPEYFSRLERQGIGVNLGTYVGAGQLRACVVGLGDRPPTEVELAKMRWIAGEAMKDGAFGLSSALQYVPGSYASTEELIELARAVVPFGGIYATHQRSEGDRLDESLDEVFTIARQAQIPIEIFHLKTAYRPNWGKMPAILDSIAAARAQGLDITADVYPYTAASTGLANCLPPWARAGGISAMLDRLRDEPTRSRIKKEINASEPGWENLFIGAGGADGVQISAIGNVALNHWLGKRLSVAAAEYAHDALDTLFDILLQDNGQTDAIYFTMDEHDVRLAAVSPLTSFCTDSSARATDGPLSNAIGHPRGWGAFPRVLAQYVREQRILTLEAAIHKMTGKPATRLSLNQRGLLRTGYFADLVLFDPETVQDRATYEESRQYPDGIPYVIVNGQIVVDQGRHTGRLAGRPLRKITNSI